MLNGFIPANGALTKTVVNQYADLKPEMMWLDLTNPTEQERQWIKQAYGQELQFMEELGEIEASARYYHDEFGMHLNQYFLLIDKNVARNVNVAFTINNSRLFTLHSEDLAAIRAFCSRPAARMSIATARCLSCSASFRPASACSPTSTSARRTTSSP